MASYPVHLVQFFSTPLHQEKIHPQKKRERQLIPPWGSCGRDGYCSSIDRMVGVERGVALSHHPRVVLWHGRIARAVLHSLPWTFVWCHRTPLSNRVSVVEDAPWSPLKQFYKRRGTSLSEHESAYNKSQDSGGIKFSTLMDKVESFNPRHFFFLGGRERGGMSSIFMRSSKESLH